MTARLLSGAAAVLIVGGLLAPASAQTPPAQADAGEAIFAQHCTACHGDTLEGGDHGPALKGAEFWSQWQGQPARRLYSLILSTMPANDPGTLSPDDALALVAHIARVNGHALPKTAATPADLDVMILPAP
jgi:mono/diheme cytochrome c family protein